MEAAQLAELHQARDDHLDVGVRRMVAKIDQAPGLGPQRVRRHQLVPQSWITVA